MCDSALWDRMRDDLAARAPLTFGDLSRGATIEAMAQDVLAAAPGRFVAVGFSMGGYVAREIVRRVPARVAGLVLIATSSRADTPQRARHKAAALGRFESAPFDGVSRTSIAGALAPDREGDEALIDHIQAMGRRLGRETFLRQTALARVGDTDRLGTIACPTLVVAGEHDRLRDISQLRELNAGIAGSTLAVVPGSGHMVPLEAPQALAGLIAGWLGRALNE